jgi:uncharacterized protein (DUF1684 family)
MKSVHLCVLAGLAASLACAPAPPAVDPAYQEEIEAWRARRESRLRSEDGWLTLVGLHWLEPGENRLGSAPDNPVALPPGTAPEQAGSLLVTDGKVTVRAAEGVDLRVDGEPVTDREIRSDADGGPDVLQLGRLSFYLIRRGERLGVRVKDPESEVRLGFTGMEHFPVDASYRLEADFVPYDEPEKREVPTAIGIPQSMLAPGYVSFTLGGEDLRLEPLVNRPEDESYFFIFSDATSGKETYGGGRFMYTERAAAGKVILDFNKAYNPPCVFTPYATCPLPPPGNTLPVRIEAGEKVYGRH